MTIALTRSKARPWWMSPFGVEPTGDVFFDRLWPEFHRDLGEEWTPSVNFSEKDDKYTLTAEIPGISKEDVTVTIKDGVLTLTGKKESEHEEKGAEYYLKETRCGSFSRTCRLPSEVNEETVDASYKDGILTVVMEKKEDSKVKKIEVH